MWPVRTWRATRSCALCQFAFYAWVKEKEEEKKRVTSFPQQLLIHIHTAVSLLTTECDLNHFLTKGHLHSVLWKTPQLRPPLTPTHPHPLDAHTRARADALCAGMHESLAKTTWTQIRRVQKRRQGLETMRGTKFFLNKSQKVSVSVTIKGHNESEHWAGFRRCWDQYISLRPHREKRENGPRMQQQRRPWVLLWLMYGSLPRGRGNAGGGWESV